MTDWYQNAIFYEIHPRAFYDSNGDGAGDLAGLTQKLDYLKDLGVDCLWLLPIYPSPRRDDGYDIADYCAIHPEYGSLADFQHLVQEAHRRGLRVIADLVLNHVSDQHPWFQAARADRNSPYRDYFVWSDTDERYREARIIFLDTERSNWTWDEQAGQFYWHRFYSSQPDLNFDNPAVRQAMLDVMDFWLKLGIDGFRADAVPYLFERPGSSCENLPETHAYLKEIRRWMEEHYPGRILLAEANQWSEDTRAYFGDGDEFHLAFHFPVMPRLFKALREGRRTAIEWILNRTPAIPETCQWCTFLRNHDELTLEMVTEEERQWMWAEYAPQPRMRLNLGIRRRLAPLLDGDPRKILLANALLLSLPGAPILYYGDEIGMGDAIDLPDRNGVRTPMQWCNDQTGGFSSARPEQLYAQPIDTPDFPLAQVNVATQRAEPHSLFNQLRALIAVRKRLSNLHGRDLRWLAGSDERLAAFWRGQLLAVHNLSATEIVLPLPPGSWRDALTEHSARKPLTLPPFGFVWLLPEEGKE